MESNFSVNRPGDVFQEKRFCYETDSTTKYLIFFIFSFLSSVVICGNLLVITSIIYFKQLHTSTNFLILSLAVTDLHVGVVVLLFTVIPIKRKSCVDIGLLDFYLSSCSVLTMCFISVDRYYAVCQPLKYRTKINVRVIVIMIVLGWTLPAIGQTITVFQDILSFFLPAIIMSAIYLKILIVAQRQARSIENTTCQRTKSESKMERKATKTLAIVMGVFLLCWTPFYIYWALIYVMSTHVSPTTFFTVKGLGWSNSMLNPFIYGLFYSWFRSAFRMIISGKIFQGDFTHSKLS